MLARHRIVGPGAVAPAQPDTKSQRKPRAKKGPRLSLLRKIEKLCHHNVSKFTGWCYAGNEFFAAEYDMDPRTIRRWFEQLTKERLIEVQIIGNIRLSRPTKRGLGALADEGTADIKPADTQLQSTKMTTEADNETSTGGHSDRLGGHPDHVYSNNLSTEYVLSELQRKVSPASFEELRKAFVAVSDRKVIFLHLPGYMERLIRTMFDVEFV